VSDTPKLPPELIPRISIAELEKRSNNEVVQVVMPLAALDAEEFREEANKMLSQVGQIIALKYANQLLVQDYVHNLNRLGDLVKFLEDPKRNQAQQFEHQCKWIKARDAEKLLRDAMGDPREQIRLSQPAPIPGVPPVPGVPGGGRPVALMPRVRLYYIAVD